MERALSISKRQSREDKTVWSPIWSTARHGLLQAIRHDQMDH